jgi:hypothetical protein
MMRFIFHIILFNIIMMTKERGRGRGAKQI